MKANIISNISLIILVFLASFTFGQPGYHNFTFPQNNLTSVYGNDEFSVDSLGMTVRYYNCKWDNLKNPSGAVRMAEKNHVNGIGYIEITLTRGLGKIYLTEYHGGNRRTGIYFKDEKGYNEYVRNDIRLPENEFTYNEIDSITFKLQYSGMYDDRTPHVGIMHFTDFIINFPESGNVFVSTGGSDENAGTIESPFATIQKASTLLAPGDTCFVREGVYHETVNLDMLISSENAPFVFMPYQNETVTLDGTEAFNVVWDTNENGICKTILPKDIWQLFLGDEMMISARWPNAESPVKDSSNWWSRDKTWAVPIKHFSDSSGSGLGYMRDNGDSGLDAFSESLDGAVAIMNINSMITYGAVVKNHLPKSNYFEYDWNDWDYLTEQFKDYINGKNMSHAWYFLECHPAFLDAPGEWYYDKDTKELFIIPPVGNNLNEKTLRGKTQSYSFNIKESKNIVIDGFNFFASTFNVENSKQIEIKNCRFDYASYSKRMLKENVIGADAAYISGTKCTLYNCKISNTDGPGIDINGDGHVIDNNLFHHIDFSCVRKRGRTITGSISNLIFRRNTIFQTGGSEAMGVNGTYHAEYNYISKIGYLQDDGAGFQMGPTTMIGASPRYNWLNNMVKMGLRFDGSEYNEPIAANMINGTMRHNVAMNTKRGFMVKGDYHKIYNNLAFGSVDNDFAIISPPEIPEYGNNFSITKNNVGGKMSSHRSKPVSDFPVRGTVENNWITDVMGDDIRTQLMDPDNLDFRPRPESFLIDGGDTINGVEIPFIGEKPDIGAYEYGDTIYWIPGFKDYKASTPIPPNGTQTAQYYADLMWLSALDAQKHKVYFGSSPENLELMGEYKNNICLLENLENGMKYFWRVDAIKNGETITGDLWSFYTGGDEINPDTTNIDTAGVSIILNKSLESNLLVYPNPASDYLYLEGMGDVKSFAIVNQLGQTIIRLHELRKTVDISGVKPGLIFIIIEKTSGEILVEKILKI